MVLVPQTQRTTARRALQLVTKELNNVNKLFAENDQLNPPLDATYKGGTVAAAKDAAAEAHSRLSWALTHFSITPIAEKTDTEMEALDPEILESDDGT